MDAVTIGSILAVAGSLVVVIAIGIRVMRLINTTHSEE